MRIRTIKPAFWHDSRLARLPEATRLFYVGLWMVADDAGWFRWDPAEVANDLYGYDRRDRREAKVETMMAGLIECGRVSLAPCGHGYIPKLVEHQHLAGFTKQVRTVENEHLKECISRPSSLTPADTRDIPRMPEDSRPGKVSQGKGSQGKTRLGFAHPREMTVEEVEEERRRLARMS